VKADGVASQESVLHGDGLGLIAMNPGREAASHETAELLRRAKAGDIEAFEQMIRLHERRVFRTALRLLRRVEDAEDAAQEVYMRLHKHLRRLKQDQDIMPWLYRVTVNVCHDANRRREPAALSMDGSERSGFEPRDPAPSPYRQAAGAEEWRAMTRALDALPEKQRASIVLRDLEGLPEESVAEILGIAQATVRTHVCRARLRLREVRQELLREKL
jgi:RNA polymerase sigma-70 factor (ECF subfamily)